MTINQIYLVSFILIYKCAFWRNFYDIYHVQIKSDQLEKLITVNKLELVVINFAF